jgi:MGT family glycosyltransferase
MSDKRFLFVVPPLTGHVNPTVSVAQVLENRGHAVAWVGHPGRVRPLLPPGARLFELEENITDEQYDAVSTRWRKGTGLVALKFLWEDFLLPLARASATGVANAVEHFQPTAMVVDQQALAGSLVARREGVPWATSCTTSAGVTNPLRRLPRVQEWMDEQLERLQLEFGLPLAESADLSPQLTLIFSSLLLVGGEPGDYPETMHFVGPATRDRPINKGAFPWDALGSLPKVLVTLGTVNMDRGERFNRVVLEAVRDRPVQAIVVAPESLKREAPLNVLVCPYVPQLPLLSRMDAVVCHGGHNTVCEALEKGLPLVVAPIRDDQPVVAQQVVDAGAGLRVRFARVGPRTLWEAIERILTEPSFRLRAREVGKSFTAAGGAEQAADLLETLS